MAQTQFKQRWLK